MISKSETAFINLLKEKKTRQQEGLFICEGIKMLNELLKSDYPIRQIYATATWMRKHMERHENRPSCIEISENQLQRISCLSTANEVLALVEIPEHALSHESLKGQLTLVLDTVQDPGNLGTILRVADWFGIKNIICSETTADAYNPKVVQASMGSIFRTKVFYTDLNKFLSDNLEKSRLPVYGAFLQGKSLYKTPLTEVGFILMGNESKGISENLTQFITAKITIPNYASDSQKASAESLNVGIASAIICAEFRRGH
jgi:TrmH family RNA methyltransferase